MPAGAGRVAMQALILAGGEGTRLRPLTSTVPKPVVPLVDRPLISYMLEWVKRHGVDDVIMSCGFLAAGVRNVLGDGSEFGVRLRFVEEPEPLGTAGALKYAEPMLDERFLMLNGDVLTDIDLTAQLAQHELTGAKATLALVAVPDPTNYGLVRLEEDAAVREFVEKPSLDAVEERPPSDEDSATTSSARALTCSSARSSSTCRRARTSRSSARSGRCSSATASTATVRKPTGSTSARPSATCARPSTSSRATSRRPSRSASETAISRSPRKPTSRGARSLPRCSNAASTSPATRMSARSWCSARTCCVGAGTTVERSVILNGTEIGEHCRLSDCIVAAGCRIGAGTRISGGAVLGEGVTVGAENVITNGARIFPGVDLPDGALQF